MRRLAAAFLVLFLFLPLVCVAEPRYVGSFSCTGCHADQAAAWQGSHHAEAMQVARARTVLGDFTDAKPVNLDGIERFVREGDRYFVRMSVAGHASRTLQVRYTFGVYPLQQYLIDAQGGRLRALTVAWDARPATQGGQRRSDQVVR